MRKSRFPKKIVWAAALVALACAAWIAGSLFFLPPIDPLKNPKASFVITVRDWNRKDHPFVLGPRNRHWVSISAVPVSLKKAVIAAEDANFYTHEGVDYEAIKDALIADLQKGKFARGGSTITQQVAKNVFLSREKTVTRKVKEFVLARRMDDRLSKARILELYLNVVELGPMVYGVGHASSYYFGKHASGLTVRESAFLASMLPGPKIYNPYRKMDRVIRRSDRILRRMFAAKMITEGEFRTALAEIPNIPGLERKVEKTLAAPPPVEKLPGQFSEDGPGMIPLSGGNGEGDAGTEIGESKGGGQETEPGGPDTPGLRKSQGNSP